MTLFKDKYIDLILIKYRNEVNVGSKRVGDTLQYIYTICLHYWLVDSRITEKMEIIAY